MGLRDDLKKRKDWGKSLVDEWLADRVIEKEMAQTSAWDLYIDFCAWSKAQGKGVLTHTRFGTLLTENMPPAATKGILRGRIMYRDIVLRDSDVKGHSDV